MIGTDKSPKFLLLYNFHITITLNCLAAHFRLTGSSQQHATGVKHKQESAHYKKLK